ncbi:MAG: site-specific DNA-methyltransferase [Gammaproteobacteria bacterium]|nr:site-specific DNA-methyltransferase [Gammaproteobacteria bacterium]
MAKATRKKTVTAITHRETSRTNIPTSEMESLVRDEDKTPIQVAFERRNHDLDPQLVWRGKYEQDQSDLHIQAPPLYIQEKVHPKALIDDLRKESAQEAPDLFSDFNGLPDADAKTEFYQHEQNWSNRMILGDSLQVMASLAAREGLRGKVQCIYLDPPYGIKFNSNFQWSTTSRDVKDGKTEHITREPEQVKAFRDTWRDGVHSYLTYLRDRLTVARELLTQSGSIFVQIGDENVHRVRAVMDEVFGEDTFASLITIRKTTSEGASLLGTTTDFVLWYTRNPAEAKFRPAYQPRSEKAESRYSQVAADGRRYRSDNITSSRPAGKGDVASFTWIGFQFEPGAGTFKTTRKGLQRLGLAERLQSSLAGKLNYIRFHRDFGVALVGNLWDDISGAVQNRADPKVYVVQSSSQLVQRCILMTTDPGDLVLDPTCGSGTTAYVAEQWGRRWITIDTSRVALALARARIMGARYPYYLLADSRDGQIKEAEVTRAAPSELPTYGHINQGFVYERVPHITLKSIANNSEIDTIYEARQPAVESALADLNRSLSGHQTPFHIDTGGRKGDTVRFEAANERVTLPSGEEVPASELLEWEVPREATDDWPASAKQPLEQFWQARIERQREIDASIAARADSELLYDKPYEDKKKVRVAGPFTVESLNPHRMVEASPASRTPPSSEVQDQRGEYHVEGPPAISGYDFFGIMLEQLRIAGVQQKDKASKIEFESLEGYPGTLICAEGHYQEGNKLRRAAILIGPEHGTVSRADLIEAAREAADCRFDVLIACAFSYDAQTTEFNRLGKLPVLKARMNADLHMSTDLKNTKHGNLFVIFGEPDIEVLDAPDNQIRVKIRGIDIFDPRTAEVRSSEPDDLACWFVDTDYNMESFFVRHAYFLGANDPYKNLKRTLKAEIDEDAWLSLKSDTSRPFPKPRSGRIAVKAINHLGDEVMKVIHVNGAQR